MANRDGCPAPSVADGRIIIYLVNSTYAHLQHQKSHNTEPHASLAYVDYQQGKMVVNLEKVWESGNAGEMKSTLWHELGHLFGLADVYQIQLSKSCHLENGNRGNLAGQAYSIMGCGTVPNLQDEDRKAIRRLKEAILNAEEFGEHLCQGEYSSYQPPKDSSGYVGRIFCRKK